MARHDSGWIKLHRSLLDHAFFDDPLLLAIWVRLLLCAYREDRRTKVKGFGWITVKRGQVICGAAEMAQTLGVGRMCVERRLKDLENEQAIEQQTSNRGRMITICNFDKYQDRKGSDEPPSEQPSEQQASSRRAAGEHRMEKREKGEKVEKREPPASPPAPPDPLDLALVNNWAEYARAESATARPDVEAWCDAVRLLRRDGFTHEELAAMLAFARADDEFWRGKATSLVALRSRSKNGLLKAENLRNAMRAAQRLQRGAPAAPTSKPRPSRPPVVTDLEALKREVD